MQTARATASPSNGTALWTWNFLGGTIVLD
jgi:hypothetical protein